MRPLALCVLLLGCAESRTASPDASVAERVVDPVVADPEGECFSPELAFVVLNEDGYSVQPKLGDFDVESEVVEIGDGLPPGPSTPVLNSLYPGKENDWRFMRITFEETTHVILMPNSSKFGLEEGNRVRYQMVKRDVGGFGTTGYELAIHAGDRLALYLGAEAFPEDLRLLPGFDVEKGDELSQTTDGCYPQAVHALSIRDRRGNSVQVAPGEKRWLGDYSVCVQRAHYRIERTDGFECVDGRPNVTQLRLVRRSHAP